MTVKTVLAAAEPGHGFTAHGWPCCQLAGQPTTTTCPGPACAPCRLEVQALHTALAQAHTIVTTVTPSAAKAAEATGTALAAQIERKAAP